jgi:chromosome segregation ATPase
MEKQIFTLLQQMNKKLDHLDFTLKEHGEILKEHGEILKEHGEILNEHGKMLKEQGEMLKEHSETLKEHGETLKEHSRFLSALRTGQEFQRAELSEMKLQNAKDFSEIKEQLKSQEDSIEILKDETWNNKKSILRVQKTMGLS